MSRLLSWLVIASVLSGCGYHLRGEVDLPSDMQRTYISAEDHFSEFYRVLRKKLESSGVEVVDSPADATAIFNIHTDLTQQRLVSVSTRNVPTEFEVFYTVSYSVESGQKSLLDRRSQTRVEDYTWDETLVLGKEHEQERLRTAIVNDLVRDVMIHLAAL